MKRYVEKRVKKGDKNIPITWDLSDIDREFERKEDGTIAIYGCGCTGFTDEGKLIKGNYTFAVNEEVSKTFTLFLKDGEPLEVRNSKGVMQKNTSGKKNVLLSFKIIPS